MKSIVGICLVHIEHADVGLHKSETIQYFCNCLALANF